MKFCPLCSKSLMLKEIDGKLIRVLGLFKGEEGV